MILILTCSRRLFCTTTTNTLRRESELAFHISYLHHCAASGDLRKTHQLHSHILTSGLLRSSPLALTALISAYSCLSLPSASLAAFNSSAAPPNLFHFNAVLSALASNSLPFDALQFFSLLRCHHRPDEFTFPCVIKASAGLPDPYHCVTQSLHADLVKSGINSDVFAASALVHAYLRFNFADDANAVFDALRSHDRDVVLWNSMVIGLAKIGRYNSAVDYLTSMMNEGISPSRFTVTGILSVFTATFDLRNGRTIHGLAIKFGFNELVPICNALIDLYGKCDAAEDAMAIFEMMNASERDDFTWNSIISALQSSGNHAGSLRMFARMRLEADVMPDAVTLATVLLACSQVAALRQGRELHSYMVIRGIRGSGGGGDVFVDNALVDMYAKCGDVGHAREVFDRMLLRDSASWNIIIDAYAAHGLAKEGLTMFEKMSREGGVAPDMVTLLAVLSACGHGGMVEEGREVLERMLSGEFGLEMALEHYACTVDMLGRAGMFDEALLVAEKAGGAVEVWQAYLAACRARGETQRAVEAAARVVELQPGKSGGWVLLANAYGFAGRFGEMAEVRNEMRERKVRKLPGCSWVELPSGLHAFITGDRQNEDSMAIYETLHSLLGAAERIIVSQG